MLNSYEQLKAYLKVNIMSPIQTQSSNVVTLLIITYLTKNCKIYRSTITIQNFKCFHLFEIVVALHHEVRDCLSPVKLTTPLVIFNWWLLGINNEVECIRLAVLYVSYSMQSFDSKCNTLTHWATLLWLTLPILARSESIQET